MTANLGRVNLALFTAPPFLDNRGLVPSAVVPRARRSSRYLLRKLVSFGGDEQRLLGHPSVTRSLLRGLSQLGVTFSYNQFNSGTTNWGILAGASSLKWAMGERFVQAGTSHRLRIVAGPTLLDDLLPIERELLDSRVKWLVLPSEWKAEEAEKSIPQLRDRIAVWTAGVNESYWRPTKEADSSKRVLVYLKGKRGAEYDVSALMKTLRSFNFCVGILRYGTYTSLKYREILETVSAVIWIGEDESQCLAQHEAWAMNIPTFVRLPGEYDGGSLRGHRNSPEASNKDYLESRRESPYLTSKTGAFWHSSDELLELLDGLSTSRYSPRDWILAHATDALSAASYLKFFDDQSL